MSRLLLTLVTLLLATSLVAAQSEGAPPTANRPAVGKITAIDAANRTFDLALRGGRTLTVGVRPGTPIAVDGNRARFQDLALGMKARVRGKLGPAKKLFKAKRVVAKS